MPRLPFRDRAAAGELLAQAIEVELNKVNGPLATAPTIVYALPRGGLPVAAPVARRLNCPMDIIVAKKIARPENPELALGAITADGQAIWGQYQDLPSEQSDELAADLQRALGKARYQQSQLASGCPHANAQGGIALLVDDGIATGMTIAAAVQSLKSRRAVSSNHPQSSQQSSQSSLSSADEGCPAAIWICAPVAPLSLLPILSQWCDRTIILETPQPFLSVSRFYQEFPQVELDEARQYLQQQPC